MVLIKFCAVLSIFILQQIGLSKAAPLTDNAYRNMNRYLLQGSAKDYKKFHGQVAKLDQAVGALCMGQAKDLEQIKIFLRDAVRAWAAVEHIGFGPASSSLIRYRIYYWPDRRNMLTKQLNKFIGASDLNLLKREVFVQGSVALQGLSALDRLVYSYHNTFKKENHFICQYAMAITTNVMKLSHSFVKEWPIYMAKALKSKDQKEIHAHYFQSFYDQSVKLLEQKLNPVRRAKSATKKKLRLEAWRSGDSLALMRINVAALRRIYDVMADTLVKRSPELHDQLVKDFLKLNSQLQGALLVSELESENTRKRFDLLAQSFEKISRLVSTQLSVALDIPVGFNSNDGD